MNLHIWQQRTIILTCIATLFMLCGQTISFGADTKLFWESFNRQTRVETLISSDINGENQQTVPLNVDQQIYDIVVDEVTQKIYWITQDSSTNELTMMRSDLDGQNSIELTRLTEAPVSNLHIEGMEEKIYWAQDNLWRMDIDGNNKEIIVNDTDASIDEFVYDNINNIIFWISVNNGNPAIKLMDLDDNSQETIYTLENLDEPEISNIIVDGTQGIVYWIVIDNYLHTTKLMYASYVESITIFEPTAVIQGFNGSNFILDSVNREIYWNAYEQSMDKYTFWSINLDTEAVQSLFHSEDRVSKLLLDDSSGKLYWIVNDWNNNNSGISCTNLNELTPRSLYSSTDNIVYNLFVVAPIDEAITTVSLQPASVPSPAVGEQLTLSLNITDSIDVFGYEATIVFDNTALQFVGSVNGDFLPANSFFVEPVLTGNSVTVAATSFSDKPSGDGTLATITFEVIAPIPSTVSFREVILTHGPTTFSSPQTEDAEITDPVTVGLQPVTVQSPLEGEQLTFSLNIVDGYNIAAYQAKINYDSTALRYVESATGDFLMNVIFELPPITNDNSVLIGATAGANETSGDGILATITFEVVEAKASTVSLSEVILTNSALEEKIPRTVNAEITEPPKIPEDLNKDGVVNIIDLTIVATNFGKTGEHIADVNMDGVVNIIDLTKVAAAFGQTEASTPAVWHIDPDVLPTRATVLKWLQEARKLNPANPTYQRGIQVLEQLLAALTPTETTLLPNYPNPFNPETWIPYQLSTDADVRISIYSADGTLVRKLEIGHKPIGIYRDRGSAAYWDGKNDSGESVASGIYFYTLIANDFTATRKMLIRK